METVFSVRSAPRLYNEVSRPAEIELWVSLEMAIEDDREEIGKKEIRL
jgi:hypothetical protein